MSFSYSSAGGLVALPGNNNPGLLPGNLLLPPIRGFGSLELLSGGGADSVVEAVVGTVSETSSSSNFSSSGFSSGASVDGSAAAPGRRLGRRPDTRALRFAGGA